MSGFRQEFLGTVKVKNGILVIAEPDALIGADSTKIQYESKWVALNTDEQGGSIYSDKALAFAADTQEAQAFANYDDHGNIVSVEIRLREQE